jgi:peptidyl-prolyl cis-trans isomerase C
MMRQSSSLAFLLSAALMICLPVVPSPSYGASKLAAMVNGTEISMDEYRLELRRVARDRGVKLDSLAEQERATLKRQVLDHLIARELLYQESVKRGVQIGDYEVKGQVEQLKRQFASGSEFTSALETLRIDEDEIRTQVAKGISVQRYIDRNFTSVIRVTEEDVQGYYDRNRDQYTDPRRLRASHILLTEVDGDKVDVRKKLELLRARILAGESFAGMAKLHSRCLSRDRGGDIGYVRAGELAPELEKAVFSMAKGEISGVVEDRFGHHLVMITELTPERIRPLSEVSAIITERMKQEKARRQASQHVKVLRQKAKVEVLLNGDEE